MSRLADAMGAEISNRKDRNAIKRSGPFHF